jgi:hypothetical protein
MQAMQLRPQYEPPENAAAFGPFAGLYSAQAQANAQIMNQAMQLQMFESCMYSQGYTKQPIRR